MSGRIYLGLDIGPDRLRVVALRRAMKKHTVLVGAKSIPLEEGIVQVELREPNIRRPDVFVPMVRKALTSLGGRENRLAVSLGAAAGLIMPFEMEGLTRNRAEGEELLRWQLKNRLPVETDEIRVDYQVLEKIDTGRARVLAGIMDAGVLEQYEALLSEAGFNPIKIEFHLLSLFNFYWTRFDFGSDFILLTIENNEIGMLYFQGGTLRFCRTRPMAANSGRLIQELHRSVVTCQAQFPGSGRVTVFLHGSDPRIGTLSETVSEIFGKEVVVLNPHQELAPELNLEHCHHLAAAIGAAEGLIVGGI